MSSLSIPNSSGDIRVSYFGFDQTTSVALQVEVLVDVPPGSLGYPGKLAELLSAAVEEYRIFVNTEDPSNQFPQQDLLVTWSVPDDDTYTP